MRIVAPLLVALCLAFTGPALAQNDGEAPPERQTSPDGRLQAIDENGNPLFDPAGGPVWELSDVERALQLFEEAVAGSRGLASGSGAWFSVATALKEAVELAPEFHEARYNLGLAFYEMNDLEGARIELDKVVDARPDLVGARVALGLVMEGEVFEL